MGIASITPHVDYCQGNDFDMYFKTLDDLSNIKNNISIYPNPAKDVVFVKSETAITKIELYDFSGKKIKESASKEMNISSLKRGNYLLKIMYKDGDIQMKNLIKE